MPLQLAERDVTRQVKDYLEFRRWRSVRMMRMTLPGQFSTGEPGMADSLFLYYFDTPPGASAALWIEFKSPRPGSKRSAHQLRWHAREKARGAVVMTVSDFDDFERRYKEIFAWLHATVGQQELSLVAAEEKW
jgi:hypothetical protein